MKKALAILLRLVGCAAVIIVTAYGARELDLLLTHRMEALKAGAMRSLEAMAGRPITYGAISPSFLQSLKVRDLAIHDAEDPGKTLLTIHEVRVYYGLWQLLTGQNPVEAIREIRLLNSRFAIDVDRDRDVVDLLLRLVQTGGSPEGLRARVTGSNIAISVVSPQATVNLEHLFFQVEAQNQSIAVSLRGKAAGSLPAGFWFSSALDAHGSLDRSLTASDMTIRVISFTSSLLNAGTQTLQLVWNGSTIDVHKIQDRSPIAIELHADSEKRQLTLSFQMQDMRPDRLITFAEDLAKYDNWLKVPFTGSGHLSYDLGSGAVDYKVDAAAYLEDQLPVRAVSVSASVRGTGKEAFFEPVRLASDKGVLEFEGSVLFDNLLPSGMLTLTNFRSGRGEKLNARLTIDRLQNGLNVYGSHIDIGEVGFDSVKLALSPISGGVKFSLATSFAGSPEEDSLLASGELIFGQQLGRAVAEGAASSIPAPVVSLTTTLKNVPPDKIYRLVVGAGPLSADQRSLNALLSHYSVSADAVLTTDFSALAVASKSITITSNDDPTTSARFGLSVDAAHVSIRDFSGSWRGFNVKGGFEGDFGGYGQLGFATTLVMLGTTYSFTGMYSRATGLKANGSYGLAVSALPLRAGGIALALKGERYPLPLSGGTIPVSFDVSGLVTPEGEWSADLTSITLYDVPMGVSGPATIQLRGKLTQQKLDLTRMTLRDSVSHLAGRAQVDIALPPDLFNAQALQSIVIQGSASLASTEGTEAYSLKGGYVKGGLAIGISFTDSPVQRLGQASVQGSLSGSGTINGPMSQPVFDLAVTLKNGRFGTDALAFSTRLILQSGQLQLKSLNASYLAHKLINGEAAFDPRKGTFSLKSGFQTEVFQDSIHMTLGVEGHYSPPTEASQPVGFWAMGLQGRLSLSGITVAGTGFASWVLAFRTADGKLSIDGGPGNSIHAWIDSTLAFSGTFTSPLPVMGSVNGALSGNRIDATANIDSLNMLVLNPILKSPPLDMGAGPVPIIRFTAGVASGRLLISGDFNDPDYNGQMEIIGGGILTAYSPDEAGPVRTAMIFEGKSFRLRRATTTAGAARLSAEASFAIDHWIPTTWSVSLNTEGQTAVRMRVRYGRLNAQGAAAGSLTVTGDDQKTAVTGSLRVSDCRITLGATPDGKFQPEVPPTIVQMSIETGRRVDFHWPSEDVPVIRTTAVPGGKLEVSYRGDTGAYTVKGATGVQGGEIYYFDRSFIMKRGSISFNEDQRTFDPWIVLRAEVREWDSSTGEEVRIYLDADSALSKFSPRFSSDPTRTETEILAMIGAPIKSRAESQGLGMAALVYSDILSQNWILRPFEQKVRQLLNLDMFSVRTQIIQNIVAQRVLGTTINPLDNTSVSLGKYIGNDLFLEMLVRLQQPQIPVSVVTAGGGLIAASTELQPDLELSLEWATPLFMLDWTFLPKHPESMFLSDNSLAFSWRISY